MAPVAVQLPNFLLQPFQPSNVRNLSRFSFARDVSVSGRHVGAPLLGVDGKPPCGEVEPRHTWSPGTYLAGRMGKSRERTEILLQWPQPHEVSKLQHRCVTLNAGKDESRYHVWGFSGWFLLQVVCTELVAWRDIFFCLAR